ncbi:MAG TPA: hypothetical protein VFP34_03145 [Microlunatus sp.]|nr:hypothetical protein [Microlunatus sp.]
MNQHLESTEEVARAMEVRSRADALRWFTDWLQRRDEISDDITNEELAERLESLAAELRSEAIDASGVRSSGLALAANFVNDSADDVRRGDNATTPDQPSTT